MEVPFGGTWYRSAVRLGGDTITPVPPFEAYNPFTWYYSASEVRQGEISLYLEFLSVDANNPKEVVNFCERFGVLGNDNKARALAKQYAIKETEASLEAGWPHTSRSQRKTYAKKMNLVLNPEGCSPQHLCRPLSIAEFSNIQCLFRSYIESPHRQSKFSALFKKYKWYDQEHPIILSPEQERELDQIHLNPITKDEPHTPEGEEDFAACINRGLSMADISPNLHWNIQKNKWELAWLSYSLLGYFWVMLLFDQLGPGKILSCPRCQKFFMTSSNHTKYCSSSCYENYKVQNYQKKKKEKEKALAALKGKKIKTRKATVKKK